MDHVFKSSEILESIRADPFYNLAYFAFQVVRNLVSPLWLFVHLGADVTHWSEICDSAFSRIDIYFIVLTWLPTKWDVNVFRVSVNFCHFGNVPLEPTDFCIYVISFFKGLWNVFCLQRDFIRVNSFHLFCLNLKWTIFKD